MNMFVAYLHGARLQNIEVEPLRRRAGILPPLLEPPAGFVTGISLLVCCELSGGIEEMGTGPGVIVRFCHTRLRNPVNCCLIGRA
jgi:hypothetical protein